MKLHLLLINLLLVSPVTIRIYSMQSSTESEVVRAVAFGASSVVAGIGLGIGSFGLYCALDGASHQRNDVAHILGSATSVPAMFVGSCAAYSGLLAIGLKDRNASKISGTIFGVSMLLNSLSHWINLKNSCSNDYLCPSLGAFTGIAGMVALARCFRR